MKGMIIKMRTNYNIRAALFDLDGVIAFTDKYHYLAWKKLAEEEGWYFDEDINNRLRGIPRMASLEVILECNNVSLDNAEKERLAKIKNDYYVELIKNVNDEDVYTGVKEFIKKLRDEGVKTAVCSSSKNANEVLGYLGISELFDAVVTGNDIKNAKPDPEIFLLGAEKVGIHPFNCVVFEDALMGIEGARRAGMKTCGVGDVETKGRADEFICEYSEIDIENFLESGKKCFFETTAFTLTERDFGLNNLNHTESLFALGNGYMGIRGVYDETDVETQDKEIPGMYINEVYEKEEYKHLWDCKGFARAEQFTVNLTDWRFVSVYIDGEKACFSNGTIKNHTRVLDMERGVLERKFEWESSNGKKILVSSVRMLNMKRVHSAQISYSVTPLNFDGMIELVSQVKTINDTNGIKATKKGESGITNGIRYVTLRTIKTDIMVAMACSHKTYGDLIEETEKEGENGFDYIIKMDVKEGKTVSLEKYVAFYTSADGTDNEIKSAVNEVKTNMSDGFSALAYEQKSFWNRHWEKGNVVIKGNKKDDFAVRFNLFHLRQQVPSEGAKSVGATGLTGYSYSGKIFWDTEMYIIPYINYTRPEETKEMLMYRYKILDKARKRAKELDGVGALYSWCSIDGDETSVVFEASTAEYHIECDVAYAINRYYRSTGDEEFLYNYGAEILFETARFMFGRGEYIEEQDGRFCLNAVCGPDEYACGVNNNFYTNMMLKFHFLFAVEVYEKIKREAGDVLTVLEKKTGVSEEEVMNWKQAAEKMYYRYNERLGIFEQDDSFVTNSPVDMDSVPKNFDVRMIMHPLDLWRKQILKQADVVMLMFVLGENYSLEEKKANYEYYEPKTNHGSSLSPAVHSIVANEVGKYNEAYDYFKSAAYMDLCDFKKNASSGIHMACLGGTWMNVVNGFLGMRDYKDKLIFNPHLPKEWESCELNFVYSGSEIKIKAEQDKTEFILLAGNAVEFECCGKIYTLSDKLTIN